GREDLGPGRHPAADPGGGQGIRRRHRRGARRWRPDEEGSLRLHGSGVSAADVGILALRVLAPILVILIVLPMLQWVERRGAGLIQDRPGPTRVGPFGLLHPLATVVTF